MFELDDVISMLTDGGTHRKQFSYNSGVQKNKSSPTFSVPFDNGLVQHFRDGTGLGLNWGQQHKQYYCFLRDSSAIERVEAWEVAQSTRVFLRNLLASTVAHDTNFFDNQSNAKTEFGSLEERAKHHQDADAISLLVKSDGVVVVSGNAAGVDFHAHYRALADGGSTILVLPEGIDHFRIRKQLREVWSWDRALVISQFAPSAPWRSYHAMARNKLILGLSKAMIVIEAGPTGGTLDAGKSTLAAKKPLFVAQYMLKNPDASGNQILIDMGGIPLNRLKSTGRANMAAVWKAFADPDSVLPQGKLL